MSELYKKHIEVLAKSERNSQIRQRKATPQALVELDSQMRFKIRAQRGSNKQERGLELLRQAQGSST